MEENLDINDVVNKEISDNTTKSNSEEIKEQRSERDVNFDINIGNSQSNSASKLDIKNEGEATKIFNDIKNMQIQNINDMTEQAIWEYNKGSKINDDDIKIAFDKKNKTLIQIEEIFKKFDFILLPSSQVFPFNKNTQYPKKINDHELDTYHRWLEVFIISSLFDLPTLTVPIGFNETGNPMGLQILAKKGDDIKLISL